MCLQNYQDLRAFLSNDFSFETILSSAMLKHLQITNYALIARTEVNFQNGFTVITGETGAGKSILLEALGLVLGSRANFNSIRKGEDKCAIEASFDIKDAAVDAFLKNNGLDCWDELILRREITRSGRSRGFINDTPVGIALLKEISIYLVDLHGQQENISLQTPTYQLKQLDSFSQNANVLFDYQQSYSVLKSIEKQLIQLKDAAVQVRKDEDYFSFQYEELNSIVLDEDEYNALNNELGELEHAEDIQRSLSAVHSVLDGDQENALSAIRAALSEMRSVHAFSQKLQELYERMNSSLIELEDIVAECNRVQQSVEWNPNRLEQVRERLDLYQKLLHKHSVAAISELIEIREEYRIKLEGIASYDSELEDLEKKLVVAEKDAMGKAEALSHSRVSVVERFEAGLIERVRQLGMAKATVKIDLNTDKDLGANGKDTIDILFDANGSKSLVPLRESASGGEVSRLMLALKSILAANDQTPTLIFDEIDTGVSGEVAKQIGALMKSISTSAQILAVTHLPGVAAKGHHHFKIQKTEENDAVLSRLEELDENERVKEIAAMFSGHKLTEAALESARNLLQEN